MGNAPPQPNKESNVNKNENPKESTKREATEKIDPYASLTKKIGVAIVGIGM